MAGSHHHKPKKGETTMKKPSNKKGTFPRKIDRLAGVCPLTLILLIILLIANISYAAPTTTTTIKGTIESLNYKQNQITILDYNGKRHTVKILPSTIISIEGVWKDIYDLHFGQEVDAILEKDQAKKITAYPEDDPERDGYIMPGSRFRTGSILSISQNEIEIKGKSGRERYRLSPATNIIKNGGSVGLFQVKVGDRVVLNFDDIYSTEVTTLRVQDGEKHISGILKGKIDLVDERNKEVLLKSPYIYKEGKWQSYHNHNIKLKTQGDQLYNEGSPLALRELKNYRNQEAYIAFDEGYGTMNISKLQIRKGSSKMYQATVEDIEYGTGKMIVNRNLIHFNPGTIVTKDNRLVDVLNIDKSKDVFVNADTIKGVPTANFVSIEGTSLLEDRIDHTKLIVYRGKIEDIYEYGIKIGKLNYRLDHLKLMEDNKWKDIKESETFELSEDTLIYDSQIKKTIPASYFISSRYINFKDIEDRTLRERLRDNYYKNKTAYFVVKESPFGKELLALNLTPHINQYRQNINLDHSTIGEIKDIDIERDSIKFTKVKNFNTLNNRWENSSDQTISIDTATILLNDVPIPQDKLYLIPKRSKAYIVKNKTSSKDMGYVILLED